MSSPAFEWSEGRPHGCRRIIVARGGEREASKSAGEQLVAALAFGMASMILAVALRDSTLAPEGTGASVSVLPAAAEAVPPLADGTAGLAPGSGRLKASRAAYSSRICIAAQHNPHDKSG